MSSKSEYANFKSEGIWRYFTRLKANDKFGEKAKRNECSKVYACTGGSTKGLHDHLSSVHAIEIRARKRHAETDNPPSDVSSSKNQITQKKPCGPMSKFLMQSDENYLQATIARMVARNGLPFRVFITSPDIRKGLEAQGFSLLPKSKETVEKLVLGHAETVKMHVCRELQQMQKDGMRFSITFDEWRSTRNRRYMKVNVHAGAERFWNIGMVRVHGSMPADKCIELLESKLSAFGLSLQNDIVAICTDGASVTKRVGTLIAAEQQLCYAHGLQLAVLDVLYKRQEKRASEPETDLIDSGPESVDDVDDDDVSQCSDNQDMKFEVVDDIDLIAELSDSYQELVQKVRQIVKIFRRSPKPKRPKPFGWQ